MNKRFITTGLLVTLLSSYVPTNSFANENTGTDVTENLKIYRKTSKTPGEEINKFGNFGYFHTYEPLGIEVTKETEVDILISGDNISGKAILRLHDVDDIHHIQEIEVGKKTTIKVPRKGQLLLDVANVVLNDEDKYKDFEISVDVDLNKNDYKVTPTFDMRANKLSDKNNLTEEEFVNRALSEDNGEDGSLMISENVRFYIPKSKYIPDYIDPDKIMNLHEKTIEVYNEKAGLDINAKDESDRPRENFILVSGANNQVGYMSAGNDMLDTHTKNIHTYMQTEPFQHWGQSHEYGHKYESPWGYQEYWCNVFANFMDREHANDPDSNWLYGSKGEEWYMKNAAKPSYDSYLKTGEVKGLHPLYYFMNFIDNYDSEYAAKMSRQSLDIPFGGADYVAAFAAKNYDMNIIPYLEMCGDKVTNEEAIKYVLENSSSTYMHMPEYEFMNEFKDISMPVTVEGIYSGENRVISGMSNKNANISIDIDGQKYETTTDEKGKFTFNIPNTVNVNSNIKIASTENGKAKSFYKDVKITDEIARVSFKGFENKEFLSLTLDGKNNKFEAVSSGNVANQFMGANYIQIKHYNKKGQLKNEFSLSGGSNANDLAKKLNEVSYIDGDYIKLSHHEQYGRLSIDGEIKNSPFILSSGVRDLDLNNSYFYILNDNLVYSNTILELNANKDDLSELIDSINLKEEDYTKTSWTNFTQNLNHSKEVLVNENASKEEVSASYELLEESINNLREINIVEFKGYNNNVFLKLGFNTENNKFEAISNGQAANPYSSGVYASIVHHDKKGNIKETYQIDAKSSADEVANKLNNLDYVSGDYLKFSHKEQNSRLVINGYVKNSPNNLENGVGSIDLSNTYFYLTGESLEYSNKQLDLSANKDDLIIAIEKAMGLKGDKYTNTSFNNLQEKINEGQLVVNTTNVTEEEVQTAIDNITKAVNDLREINKIEFKGYNNETFLELEFDMENNKFKAVSNGKTVHPYQYSREYVSISHYDQKGNLKKEYSVNANETADKMANELNKATFSQGDYIKLNHIEKNSRLIVDGYVENAPYDLGTGAYDLDLASSYFYINENLSYSNTQLDLSADKTLLVDKIEEAKIIQSDEYTKTSYDNLQKAIENANDLVKATNVYEEEITNEIEKLEKAINDLRKVNIIVFEGINNNESLKLSFDTEAKKFKAVSNGETIHPYQGANYFKITHYDKKGNIKETFSASGSSTADDMANKLNKVTYVDGDYLKLHHGEPNSRLEIEGYIKNSPKDLSNGVGHDLDLNNSYFYLNGESLEYSNTQLDLSADKELLKQKIEEAKDIDKTKFTKTSYENLQNIITESEKLISLTNLYEEEITKAIKDIEKGVSDLRKLNTIVFEGMNNNESLKLSFDTETKEFKAISNGQTIHQYMGANYFKITHYDKKGNIKNTFSASGSSTADDMANELNTVSYVDGDYLKLHHAEQNHRLEIEGYIKNSPKDLSNGVGDDLDLANSYFYLNGESLEYSSTQLDLSADKTLLTQKIEEAKNVDGANYTKTSYENLQNIIIESEKLISSTNVYEDEINKAIKDIEKGISDLRKLNTIVFEGINNNESLKLSFDTEAKKFKAVSNGQTIHQYMGANYFNITHYDKKGNVKETFSASGGSTADDIANKLNKVTYVEGDYLKLHHAELSSRLEIEGYIKNSPKDLSNGVGHDLDLNNSYFYLNGESLEYSTTQLDLSANKDDLKLKIEEAKKITSENYTKTTFETLRNVIVEGDTLINATNVDKTEINDMMNKIDDAINSLREINLIEFKGYNNEVFLTLSIDKENNKFVAKSSNKVVHPYQYSRVYSTVMHYDKDNNIKGEYSVLANQTADEMADLLNQASIESGDYIKINHLEQGSRLCIKGYINNLDKNLENGVGDLNLDTAIFNLDDENLTYKQ